VFQIRHSVEVTTARLIGYWRLDGTPLRSGRYLFDRPPSEEEIQALRARWQADESRWPDPRRFVDSRWDLGERRLVADYLERGTRVNQYRGLSPCRFCGQNNGSAELTDGAYCWPEGLAHYLNDHEARLPDEFVVHVRESHLLLVDAPRPSFEHLGQRDRSWPGPEFAHLLWAPDDPNSHYGLRVKADPTWWLQQSGISTDAP
jgi:hypothetical protein